MHGSFTLVFETSTPQASLATVDDRGQLDQREFTSDRSHNAVLFSPLQKLLAAQAAAGPELVLVGSGPGSYSGTRVGIAAAQGVAIACGCPAVALPSILAVPSARCGGACLAIGDARRGTYWIARIEDHQLLTEPALTDAQGLLAAVSHAVAGKSAVVSFDDPFRFPLPSELQSEVRLEFPDARGLWLAWNDSPPATRDRWLREIPQPLYLKPPHITPAKRPWLVRQPV
ncbi:MAG: tRNA (adenosine(37)-N6)-threonylcarbamoyltransferase complex dimerization subunit type 1 TsaB [Akkermansiaceae bacterium]